MLYGLMSEVNNLTAVRLEKRAALLGRGVRAYGAAFPVTGDVGEVRAGFVEGGKVVLAGRVTARRDMGKSHFLDVSDHSGRMQVYLQDKALGEEAVAVYKLLDIGDFVGVEGECFTTKTGEPSVKAEKFVLLSKSLYPLPEKWHGLQDVEARHRQRYLDLIANEHARNVFRQRFAINPIANNVCEFGLGFASGTVTPTDGVYFKLNSAGVLVGVMNINGTETTTAPMPAPVANEVYYYRIVIDQDRIEFFIDGALQGVILSPNTSAAVSLSRWQPLFLLWSWQRFLFLALLFLPSLCGNLPILPSYAVLWG